jgi:DNA-binding LacI/PurR family transcriptional regulator
MHGDTTREAGMNALGTQGGNGRAAPTLDDVARVAGVSRATVSRVVNGGRLVSPETGAAVARAIAQLGYQPNRLARALATSRAGAVAVVVPETAERVFADPFHTQAYLGALNAFAGSDERVLLAMSQPGEDVTPMARYLGSGHVDGAIVLSHHGPGMGEILLQSNCPAVFIGDPGVPGLSYVELDQLAAAITATRHLVERGSRRIATVTGPMDMGPGLERLRGFRTALADAGLAPLGWLSGDFTARGGEAATAELLRRFPDLDGLFVASDLMASGALQALRHAGRRVPDDVALVGFDDSPVALQTHPLLTTMTNPALELARIASGMLIGMLAGEQPDGPVILTSRLIVRDSA